VVSAEFHCLAVDAGHGPRVSSVGAVDELWSDEYDIGGAASVGVFLILGSVFLFLHFLLDGGYHLLAVLGGEQDVHLHEGLTQGLLISGGLVVLVGFQLADEVALHVGRHLGT